MSTNHSEKPKNLNELLGLKQTISNLTPFMAFSALAKGIDLSDEKAPVFKDGDYSLKNHPDINKAMEVVGQKIIDLAAKKGVKISDLPEFKTMDLNADGTHSAKEIGAVVLAISLNTVTLSDQKTKVESTFDDKLAFMDVAAAPYNLAMIKAVAKQLLQDNGVTVTAPEDNTKFVQNMKNLANNEIKINC